MSYYWEPHFPIPQNYSSTETYLEALSRSLSHWGLLMSLEVRGLIRNDAETESYAWRPVLTTGASYQKQTGHVFRQRGLVDVWFDLNVDLPSPLNMLSLEAPYAVAFSTGTPFVGIAWNGTESLSLQAVPATRTLQILLPSAKVSFPSLRGHIRYLGELDE